MRFVRTQDTGSFRVTGRQFSWCNDRKLPVFAFSTHKKRSRSLDLTNVQQQCAILEHHWTKQIFIETKFFRSKTILGASWSILRWKHHPFANFRRGYICVVLDHCFAFGPDRIFSGVDFRQAQYYSGYKQNSGRTNPNISYGPAKLRNDVATLKVSYLKDKGNFFIAWTHKQSFCTRKTQKWMETFTLFVAPRSQQIFATAERFKSCETVNVFLRHQIGCQKDSVTWNKHAVQHTLCPRAHPHVFTSNTAISTFWFKCFSSFCSSRRGDSSGGKPPSLQRSVRRWLCLVRFKDEAARSQRFAQLLTRRWDLAQHVQFETDILPSTNLVSSFYPCLCACSGSVAGLLDLDDFLWIFDLVPLCFTENKTWYVSVVWNVSCWK